MQASVNVTNTEIKRKNTYILLVHNTHFQKNKLITEEQNNFNNNDKTSES